MPEVYITTTRKISAAAIGTFLAITSVSDPCSAQETTRPWTVEATYTADVTGVVSGGPVQAGRFLDNLDVIVDGDLERLIGAKGARLHVYLLNNNGGEPNAVAGTLQGVDNIEVGDQGARLYELWVEQDFGADRGSVLAGLYDVNSEFYSTGASDLLVAPPFGIGSELAATGPNGPSIFPSTALAARIRFGSMEGTYVQAAAVNASASTLGDVDGIDADFDHGGLFLAEAGWTGPVRIALGGWRYGERQDDIRDLDLAGDPVGSIAQGAYVLAEGEFYAVEDGVSARAFLRAGISDGDTTDFNGGWQAGVRLDHLLASRPDSALSLGFHQGRLSDKARANARDAGGDPALAEEGLELTAADTFGRLTIQPSVQWIQNPGGDRAADAIVVATLRLSVALR
ncbi:carbohydrate porin [Brevundimonas sp. Root1279]|uniref:carbohydrate porin n=1 Tax=Brevundimonas sp. Root1279 TaxID=1736443 RepID=UPI0006F4A02E|nr:carbohydrate porin [Brevundimonas sp. Root1279]KQW82196.1 porin [Brevundimonas sp. Root1279]